MYDFARDSSQEGKIKLALSVYPKKCIFNYYKLDPLVCSNRSPRNLIYSWMMLNEAGNTINILFLLISQFISLTLKPNYYFLLIEQVHF